MSSTLNISKYLILIYLFSLTVIYSYRQTAKETIEGDINSIIFRYYDLLNPRYPEYDLETVLFTNDVRDEIDNGMSLSYGRYTHDNPPETTVDSIRGLYKHSPKLAFGYSFQKQPQCESSISQLSFQLMDIDFQLINYVYDDDYSSPNYPYVIENNETRLIATTEIGKLGVKWTSRFREGNDNWNIGQENFRLDAHGITFEYDVLDDLAIHTHLATREKETQRHVRFSPREMYVYDEYVDDIERIHGFQYTTNISENIAFMFLGNIRSYNRDLTKTYNWFYDDVNYDPDTEDESQDENSKQIASRITYHYDDVIAKIGVGYYVSEASSSSVKNYVSLGSIRFNLTDTNSLETELELASLQPDSTRYHDSIDSEYLQWKVASEYRFNDRLSLTVMHLFEQQDYEDFFTDREKNSTGFIITTHTHNNSY